MLVKAEVGVREAAASQMYPYMNWRSLVNYGADARVKCYLGQFELTAKAGYAAGKVVEESWLVSEQAGVQTTPFRLQDYYDRQMEYATAARLNAGLALRWNFWKGLYVQADGCLTHAFSLRYIVAHNRVVASFRFGYNF